MGNLQVRKQRLKARSHDLLRQVMCEKPGRRDLVKSRVYGREAFIEYLYSMQNIVILHSETQYADPPGIRSFTVGSTPDRTGVYRNLLPGPVRAPLLKAVKSADNPVARHTE